MQVKSLAYRTDLWFPRFDGHIVDRGDYLVIATPSNPTFVWGNFLLFPRPPGPGDLEAWQALFEQELGQPFGIRHQAFGWDFVPDTRGDLQPFLDQGFQLEDMTVLVATSVNPPPRRPDGLEVRALSSDDDWEQATQNQIACRGDGYNLETYEPFKRRQMDRYRDMARAGLGDWFGAFVGPRLIGDLGLFFDGSLGRFQNVGTHPDHRRKGVAGEMLYRVCSMALSRQLADQLVIVVDADTPTERLYRSVGFSGQEYQRGMQKMAR